ncbi:MAG: hypothetical protein ACREV4_08550 [Gammaproteobacteria bacterium]
MAAVVTSSPSVHILPDGRMDTRNASLYVGLTEKTMAIMRTKGEGPPFVKVGRIFYYRKDVDQWLRGSRVLATSGNRRKRTETE